MISPPHCSSKDTPGTASEVTCEAAISLLAGCSNKGTSLRMSTKPSSNAISADCRGLLQADCLKQPKDCLICSSSGGRKSVCPRPSMNLLRPRSINGYFAMLSTWSRSLGLLPAPVVTISRFARRFLTACFGTAPLVWPSLQAQQVADFVQQEASTKRGHGRKLPSTAVRSSVSHLLHTLYLVHFRAFLHEIDNVQRKVFNRLIDLNVMLSGRGRSDSVVVFLQSSQ